MDFFNAELVEFGKVVKGYIDSTRYCFQNYHESKNESKCLQIYETVNVKPRLF